MASSGSATKKLGMSLDEIVDGEPSKYGKAGGKGGRKSSRSAPYEGSSDGNRHVFVGNLPYSASWQDLKDHMRSAGNVLHCDIIAQPGTALGSKGCGLVEFSTAEEAKRAIDKLQDTEIQGRPIFVREDREVDAPVRRKGEGKGGGSSGGGNPCVFVGNLPYSISWQDLKDHMRKAGHVIHCDIIQEPGTACGSKGCGLVQFSSGSEARRAIKELSETMLKGRPIFIREDREAEAHEEPRRRSDRSPPRRRNDRSPPRSKGGGGNCRVFVGNLAFSVTWQDLKDHMRSAGDVVHCDIMKQPGTALGSKGCGLVEFASARDAKRAIRDMTDTMLRGRPIWVREDREA